MLEVTNARQTTGSHQWLQQEPSSLFDVRERPMLPRDQGLDSPPYLQTILHEGGLHTAELSVVNASAALDYATFTCTAQNSLGLDTFDIHLVSISRPDPPTGLSVLSKSHNSVTLAWNQGFNGGLEQTFQIRYTSAETLSYLYADVYPAQAMSFTITGLRAQTAYNFSVGALNTLGSSDYTDVLNVITS
ncbi:hypothetical protein scyTo_0021886, partial [Scyliorhinus torazame]|nr:hypothetical protein [Scyliorhinus torazame]